MAISYGTITITDKTDLGQLSVYLTGSTVNQQTCDINSNTYYPNWDTQHEGTALVITPHAYYNNEVLDITNFTVVWKKQENGGTVITVPKQLPDATDPETLAQDGKSLVRNSNLALNSTGVVYTATISYKPIPNDNDTIIQATATISFSITSYGQNGQAGSPGKSLQLIGSGSSFTYTWNDTLYGNSVIELAAQKDEINYICWECDGQTIYSGAHPSTTGTTKYTGTSLRIGGDSTTTETATTVRIDTLSTNWANNGYAQFQIFEADSNGNKVTNGFEDYFVIYKYKEAAPGDSLYTSYLDNNEETIVTYQGIMDLSGATTRLYINEGGSSDITNWHITVTDTIGNVSQFNYVLWNSLDYPNGVFRGHSTTQITNNGTQNPTINGTVVQTSSLTTNSLVSYSNNGSYDVFCWDGAKWVLTKGNLQKYGPDCAAVIAFEINTAKINFTAQRGVYEGNNFTPDLDIAALHNSFSINKSASVIGHSLRLSTVNSNKMSGSNVYDPATVEIAAIQRSNSGVEAYTQAGSLAVIIYYKDQTPALSRLNLTPPYTITLANEGNVSYIEAFLGDGSTSGDGIEDKQTVTISTDGVNGTSPWLFTTGNPYDGISTDYSYKATSTKTYSIPLNAAQGTTPKTLYHMTSGTIQYPNVIASCDNSTINNALTYKYNGAAMTTSGADAYKVDELAFTVSSGTVIGSEGTITITFYSSLSNSVERLYTYKAMPEALKPITAQIYAEPSTVFTNQTGTSIAIPDITSGTSQLVGTSAINSYTWYAYIVGEGWKLLTNNTSAGSGEVHIDGVAVGNGTIDNWTNAANGSVNSQRLKVSGSAVPGYLGFKLVANITAGGSTGDYAVLINFTDINDPLQVTLHSTLGEQLVNGQGVGVIYARVLMGNVAVDEIPPDDKLGVGPTAPENADNTGDFQGKLGYCVYLPNNNYFIDYYERNATNANWVKRTSTEASYSWYFRDNENEPIDPSDTTIAVNLRILSQVNGQGERTYTNQQFIYLNKDTVKNKLTADVKVEKI